MSKLLANIVTQLISLPKDAVKSQNNPLPCGALVWIEVLPNIRVISRLFNQINK